MIVKRTKVTLAENLNRLMNERDWSINETARKSGMSKSTLHNFCCGVIPKNIQSLKDLADLFEVSLNDLIAGENRFQKNVIHKFSFDDVYEILVLRKTSYLPKDEGFETGTSS
ncbi:MAG: hypothetical protein A4S09_06480 [Proteobacteria bacterium SG_bin7]|nr:MAG: hypothetical protein A4S09_06480 [Proteobacteria bacterium SG_bin7]